MRIGCTYRQGIFTLYAELHDEGNLRPSVTPVRGGISSWPDQFQLRQ